MADDQAELSTSTEHERSLGQLVKNGLAWSLASNGLSRVGTLATGIVLARLLGPRDYGQFTVALVALLLIANVNDIGLETTIVRWPGDVDRIAPTAITLIFGSSCLLFGALFGVAPIFARALNAPQASGVVRLLAVGVVVNGAFAVPSGLLTRCFRQDRRTAADMAGFLVSTAVTIVLAAKGYGAWSLAWGRLVGNLVNGLLHFAFAPSRYRPGWSRSVAVEILRIGMPIAGTSLVEIAVMNVDYLVVGRVLGPVALGFYLMAFNLSSWPVNMFSVAVNRVSVPGFARLQHDPESLRNAFNYSLALLMKVTMPVCVLMGVLAVPVIRFVYGARWAPAAHALKFLVVMAVGRVALHLASDVLVAVGRGRQTLLLQLLWIVALGPSITIGAKWHGIAGAGLAHVAVMSIIVIPAFGLALAGLGIRPRRLAGSLARPLLGGIAAAIIALVARSALSGDFWRLAAGGSGGMAAYLLVVAPLRILWRGLHVLMTRRGTHRAQLKTLSGQAP